MAGNNFKKSTGNINSSWMRNALKSLGMASTDIIKDMIPATAETFSSASKLAQDTARTIRSNRVGNGRIGDAIKTNPAVKLGQDFLRKWVRIGLLPMEEMVSFMVFLTYEIKNGAKL